MGETKSKKEMGMGRGGGGGKGRKKARGGGRGEIRRGTDKRERGKRGIRKVEDEKTKGGEKKDGRERQEEKLVTLRHVGGKRGGREGGRQRRERKGWGGRASKVISGGDAGENG